jgi:site-specific DNA-methyltransferase (adenine-specific)
LDKRFLGIDLEKEYLELGKNRKIEIENPVVQKQFKEKMNGFKDKNELSCYLLNEI